MSPMCSVFTNILPLTVFFKKNNSFLAFSLGVAVEGIFVLGESGIISGYGSVICKERRERNIPEG